MGKKVQLFLLPCIISLAFVSCSQDSEPKFGSNDSMFKSLYEKMKDESSIPLFSIINNSRAKTIEKGYPEISQQDLEYLSELSPEELESLHNKLVERLEDNGIIDMDSIQDENYIKIFQFLGGHEGMDKFIKFTEDYMNSSKGWEQIERLIPNDLTTEQGEIYITMATYVDRIGRPIYCYLSSQDNPISRSDNPLCRELLKQKLEGLGIDMTVDAFLDLATGGLATEDEMFVIGVDIAGIWLDYEHCNGRWH